MLFRALCLVATAIMILYWIVKFLRNEDVSLVEWRLFENTNDIAQPELTICLHDPFIDEKLERLVLI